MKEPDYNLKLEGVNKLSLVPTDVKEKQILMLMQKTPKKYVYKRPAKGGGEWSYVTGTYVKKILNYVFGFMWDFQIIDKGREGDVIWVQGRLTIRNKSGEPMIIKEQFGRKDIAYKRGTKDLLDYGNDLKSASTDALKKCASELGVASDIYGAEEFKEIQFELKKTLTESAEIVDSEAPATENQIEVIKQLGGEDKKYTKIQAQIEIKKLMEEK